jgi:hypothetical protein
LKFLQQLPKFISEGVATYHELRKRGTSSAAEASPPCRRAIAV